MNKCSPIPGHEKLPDTPLHYYLGNRNFLIRLRNSRDIAEHYHFKIVNLNSKALVQLLIMNKPLQFSEEAEAMNAHTWARFFRSGAAICTEMEGQHA